MEEPRKEEKEEVSSNVLWKIKRMDIILAQGESSSKDLLFPQLRAAELIFPSDKEIEEQREQIKKQRMAEYEEKTKKKKERQAFLKQEEKQNKSLETEIKDLIKEEDFREKGFTCESIEIPLEKKE